MLTPSLITLCLQSLLRDVGRTPGDVLEFRDPQGYTPLVAAAHRGNLACVDLVSPEFDYFWSLAELAVQATEPNTFSLASMWCHAVCSASIEYICLLLCKRTALPHGPESFNTL